MEKKGQVVGKGDSDISNHNYCYDNNDDINDDKSNNNNNNNNDSSNNHNGDNESNYTNKNICNISAKTTKKNDSSLVWPISLSSSTSVKSLNSCKI